MKHRKWGIGLALVVAALVLPSVARANEVTKWNEIAVSTVNAQPPITSAPNAGSVFIAMVQGAVYGAVNAADRHGRPYLVNRSFPKASVDAAAATAAYKVLSALFPSAALDTAYAASITGIPAGTSRDEGVEVGTMAANTMLAEGHDGRTVIGCTFGSGLPGVWLPLAGPTGAPLCDPTPWVANAVPFIVKSASQFRTRGPDPLSSPEYAADVNEVKAIGSLTSATRTAAQTHAAPFWQTNPGANYNAMARRFIDQIGLGVSDSARLLAELDLSAADALINTWNDKYFRNFWRPITAIRHADTDGNPATTADPTWTPLFDPSLPPAIGGVGPALITPPYPEHPSGATAYASASMSAFASFFGTDQRVFHHFSDLTNEVLEARIWAGIHFRNADVQAATLGRDVASYVHAQYFTSAH
jgi:PAP2 superfamily